MKGSACGQFYQAYRCVFIEVPSGDSAVSNARQRGDNHHPNSLRLSFVRARCFAGGSIAVHSNLPLSHQQCGQWQGRREWQATRSEEGHGDGGKGNGDGDEGGW